MKHSTFKVANHSDAKRNMMHMAVRTTEGKLAPMDYMYPENTKTNSGGMGVVSSVGDSIHMTNLIKEEPQLLRPEMRDRMFEPQFDASSKQAKGMMSMGFMHENLTGGEKSLGAFSFGLGGLITV
ncbi:hypothetical protein EDB81DRAFT_894630 [Dactylonectria macrodidyma]|uniref:Uncharacterized protein n=1 Tax=Dactylonectria macrodidyma TaxID=307937 RepID=A0A9P9I8A9_9HYPO|nr:hypothetical protein EDB81DRAFT_894630 [Dactylonectria macrodidyma]